MDWANRKRLALNDECNVMTDIDDLFIIKIMQQKYVKMPQNVTFHFALPKQFMQGKWSRC